MMRQEEQAHDLASGEHGATTNQRREQQLEEKTSKGLEETALERSELQQLKHRRVLDRKPRTVVGPGPHTRQM